MFYSSNIYSKYIFVNYLRYEYQKRGKTVSERKILTALYEDNRKNNDLLDLTDISKPVLSSV